MSIVRVGSTGKYADGWDIAFGKKRRKATTTARRKTATKKATPRKARKK